MTPEKLLAPREGRVLLSEPFLNDPNFMRSVVLLLNHDGEGTFGVILNHPSQYKLSDLLNREDLPAIEVFEGGPVEMNTLHFVHQIEEISEHSRRVNDAFWWGGDLENALNFLKSNPKEISNIKFFVGYSGWGANQLLEERKQNAWWIAEIGTDQLFSNSTGNQLWKTITKGLGPDFKIASESPLDPQWN